MYFSELVGPFVSVASLFLAYAVNENSAVCRFLCVRLGFKVPPTFHATPSDVPSRRLPDCDEVEVEMQCRNSSDSHFEISTEATTRPRPSTFWAFDVLDPRDAVTLRWGPEWLLVASRAVAAMYMPVCLLLQVYVEGEPMELSFLPYLTNWSLILLSATGLWGFILAISYSITKARPTWNFATCGYVLLQQTVQMSGILVTVFYWGAEATGGKPRLQDLLRHGINIVIIFVDTAFSRTPVVSYHILFCFFLVSAYSFFMWCYYAGTGDFTYASLAFSADLSIVYYVVVPLIATASFYVWFGLVFAREVMIRALLNRRTQNGREAARKSAEAAVIGADVPRAATEQHGHASVQMDYFTAQPRNLTDGWTVITL